MCLLSREAGRLGNNDWKLFLTRRWEYFAYRGWEREFLFSVATEGQAGAKECCHLTPDLSFVGVHLNKYMGFRFARKVVFVTSWS